jgi:hypothetical protein
VTYTSYADQSLSEILPHLDLKQINKKVVNNLATTWFEYKDGKFIQRTLPLEANFSPVYAIYTDDFNGDGIMDILLGGNIEYTRIRIGKNDASYGTLLLGKGVGKFEYVPQNESGLDIKGCVRSFIPIKNSKGQTKILVGINNEFAQLLETNSITLKQKN